MSETLEEQFGKEMFSIYQRANDELGYNASRYFQMLANDGALHTATTLVLAKDFSQGMTFLWKNKRLDLSVEALVINPKWASLFSTEVREAAKRKLRQLGYTKV